MTVNDSELCVRWNNEGLCWAMLGYSYSVYVLYVRQSEADVELKAKTLIHIITLSSFYWSRENGRTNRSYLVCRSDDRFLDCSAVFAAELNGPVVSRWWYSGDDTLVMILSHDPSDDSFFRLVRSQGCQSCGPNIQTCCTLFPYWAGLK